MTVAGDRGRPRRTRSVHRPGPARLAVLGGALCAALAGCTAGTAPDEPPPRTSAWAEPAGSPQRTAVAPGPSRPGASAPAPAPAAPPVPAFTATVGPITDELAARMATSWRRGCPVPLSGLRYVTLTHWDMAGNAVTGELVVGAEVADSLVEVFRTLFAERFPVASMRLVDDFGGSDDASMAADNTSAFNCRAITGGTGWSEHAYGRAIDVNPVENPYVVAGGHVAPPAGRAFADRHPAPGVVLADDLVVRAFAAQGWRWGGDWTDPTDYQHFSTTGR